MGKRFTVLICVFALLFSGLAGRCGYIAMGSTYRVSDSYNSYTINIGRLTANIFDRAGTHINNKEKAYSAVIRPNEKCLSELSKVFDDSEIADITAQLAKGYPVVRNVSGKADTKYIKIYEKITNDADSVTSPHLIAGMYGGLESYACDEIGSLSVNFAVDALGRLLAGDEGTVVNNNYDSKEGIIISLDNRIQQIAEEGAKSIPYGAVVIVDTESSQVLASVSKGGDYINRAVSPYAVGSVFKLIVSACAIENNIQPIFNCTSQITVSDIKFNCQKNKSHGIQTIKQALANSCNCYFVNLALKLGPDKLSKTAEQFGFGSVFELYSAWNIKSGIFPAKEELALLGQLALIGFGQGKLTDSPMHFAAAVSCIANGGNYSSPTLELKDVEENRVISQSTSEKLREYMRYVVSSGTGGAADYKKNSAGKTATAQSGIYVNNIEVLNTWFAGFYPYNEPKYTIVIMRENGVSGAVDCCPIFRSIVEKLDTL